MKVAGPLWLRMLPRLGWICLAGAVVTAGAVLWVGHQNRQWHFALVGDADTCPWAVGTFHEWVDWGAVVVALLLGAAMTSLCRIIPLIVAARQRADEGARELMESERRIRSILDTAVEGIITIDERGIVDSFNAAAERIFGYTAREVIGNSVNMLMPSPDREHHDEYLIRYVQTGQKKIICIGRELLAQRKDGTIFPAELSVSEVRLPDRRLFTGIVRDISERRKAQEQLRKSEERARQRDADLARVARLGTIGVIASGLAHELNQPLSAIVNYIQACLERIRAGQIDREELLADLQCTAEQAERAGQIVDHIHGFVRKRRGQPSEVNLNGLVRELLDLLRPAIWAGNAQVELKLAPEAPPVLADPIALEQVIINLAGNGLEAMAGNNGVPRRLTIETSLNAGQMVELAVRDTGPGLSKEVAARLFTPFFTTKPEGMGLGLAISRSIIEAHGGRLWVASNPDGGATFRFTLPAAQAGGRA